MATFEQKVADFENFILATLPAEAKRDCEELGAESGGPDKVEAATEAAKKSKWEKQDQTTPSTLTISMKR